MVNASLRDGLLSASEKYAIVSPLLKKPFLDPASLHNYHPVSNVTFASMIIERIVASLLISRSDILSRMT